MKIHHQRWQEIDARLAELEGGIDLDTYLSPVNRRDELDRWLEARRAGRRYEPQFVFEPLPDVREPELRSLLAELDRDDPVQALYASGIELRLGEIEMARTHDGRVISHHSSIVYGQPGPAILEAARRNLAEIAPEDEPPDDPSVGAEEAADICRRAMSDYGFTWQVVVKKEMGAKALVDNLIREFWIRSDVVFPMRLMKMMVVHEIGTHILRTENGYAQPLGIFGRGLPAYQLTEEGLAEYTERETGCLHDDTVRRISARVIGVDICLRGSFCDAAEAVVAAMGPEMAFDVAQRAKLGQADSSQPGAFTKDYVYLEGLARVTEWFEAGPSHADLNAMFAGKVGFRHLDLVRALQAEGYLRPPARLPEWLRGSSLLRDLPTPPGSRPPAARSPCGSRPRSDTRS